MFWPCKYNVAPEAAWNYLISAACVVRNKNCLILSACDQLYSAKGAVAQMLANAHEAVKVSLSLAFYGARISQW